MAGQHELDIAAQQMGFPNYATWAAWNAKYKKKKPVGSAVPAAQPKPKRNWLQSLGDIPPFTIINRVNDAYGKATGQ